MKPNFAGNNYTSNQFLSGSNPGSQSTGAPNGLSPNTRTHQQAAPQSGNAYSAQNNLQHLKMMRQQQQ